MARQQRSYSRELEAEAVKRVIEKGDSVADGYLSPAEYEQTG